MVGLTPNQQVDLNFAICEYLLKSKYSESAATFTREASVDFEGYLKASNTPAALQKDILERKWTSIARLKKQVMDLERQCKQLTETNEQHQLDIQTMEKNGGKSLNKDKQKEGEADSISKSGDAIPREPEKKKLMGHRARVTKVQFHPTYTQLATSSEDASIKIWDYETGECE